MLFIIPEPVGAPATPVPEPAPEPEKPAEPELLHIPCPNGHELEVPPEMLDTEVLCPHCNAQFHLRAKDSIEHRKRREQAEALREAQTNKFWYQFSIGVVIVVALLLMTLIIMSMLPKNEVEPKATDEEKSNPAKVKPKPKPADTEPAANEVSPQE
jgi:hypothetical protein